MSAAKLTAEQIKEIQDKYANGMTQKALAEEYGVSQALIQKRCGGPYRGYRGDLRNSVIYKNISEFMKEKGLSFRRFSEECCVNYATLFYVLTWEHDPKKSTIDKILGFTGLTYERAFAVDD